MSGCSSWWCAALLAAALAGLSVSTEAAVFKGQVRGKQFAFLGKFCFGHGEGIVGTLTGNVNTNQKNMFMYFYDDQPNQWPLVWPAVEKGGMSCLEATGPDDPAPLGVRFVNTTGGWTFREGYKEVERPRFWYVAVAINECDGDVDILSYDLTFKNKDSQLSVDQYGLLEMYVLNVVVNVLVLLVTFTSLRLIEATPSIVRLFLYNIGLHTISCLCYAIHWLTFKEDGIGVAFLEGVGAVLEVGSIMAFWLMATLMAVGFGISVYSLESRATSLPVGMVVLLVVCFLANSVWYELTKDPASTKYEYASAPGASIVALNLVYFFWFVVKLRHTWLLEVQKQKQRIYLKFAVLVCGYLLVVPVAILIGMVSKPWVRARVVRSMAATLGDDDEFNQYAAL